MMMTKPRRIIFGGICGMYAKDKNAHRVLFGKPERNRYLGRLSINVRTLQEENERI
jgi:hypothetical protein